MGAGINRIVILIFFLATFLSYCPVSAHPAGYCAFGWDESLPESEAKAPVPINFWEVSPLTFFAVMLVLVSPAFLVPAEVILAGAGVMSLNFRRIDKKTILDNDCRKNIYNFIVENPGTDFTGIKRGLLVNRGTLDYHLGILKKEHMIAVYQKNKRSYYFENSGKYSCFEMEMLVCLKNDISGMICRYLVSSPDASRNDIAKTAGMSCSTVLWHLRKLCDAGLLSSSKKGRIIMYRLSPAAYEIMGRIYAESPCCGEHLLNCSSNVIFSGQKGIEDY